MDLFVNRVENDLGLQERVAENLWPSGLASQEFHILGENQFLQGTAITLTFIAWNQSELSLDMHECEAVWHQHEWATLLSASELSEKEGATQGALWTGNDPEELYIQTPDQQRFRWEAAETARANQDLAIIGGWEDSEVWEIPSWDQTCEE